MHAECNLRHMQVVRWEDALCEMQVSPLFHLTHVSVCDRSMRQVFNVIWFFFWEDVKGLMKFRHRVWVSKTKPMRQWDMPIFNPCYILLFHQIYRTSLRIPPRQKTNHKVWLETVHRCSPYVRQGTRSPTHKVLLMTISCVPSNQCRLSFIDSSKPTLPFSSSPSKIKATLTGRDPLHPLPSSNISLTAYMKAKIGPCMSLQTWSEYW